MEMIDIGFVSCVGIFLFVIFGLFTQFWFQDNKILKRGYILLLAVNPIWVIIMFFIWWFKGVWHINV